MRSSQSFLEQTQSKIKIHLEMENVYVGCSFFMNKGFVEDGAFSRKMY
jgi:hypothetical protein